MKRGRLKVHRAEEWQKTVNEAAEQAYALLNSDKRRA
jgi:16S rRNA U1498 N3-methylase RsmE